MLAQLAGVALLAMGDIAAAGWREEIGTFRIGLLAESGGDSTIAGLPMLREAYQRALGMPVEMFVARDYAALVDAQASGRIEYAVYSAMAYASAWQLCACVEPLASPLDEDRSTGLRSILIVRDGAFATPADAAGHRIAIPPREDVVGHRFPIGRFKAGEAVLSGDEPFLVTASGASDAERMLAEGEVDALFGWTPSTSAGADAVSGGTRARLEAAGMEPARLSVVWRSDLLRYGPHAVRTGLDPEAKAALTAFLTGLKGSFPDVYDLIEVHHSGGFAETSHEDYATAVDLVTQVATQGAAE